MHGPQETEKNAMQISKILFVDAVFPGSEVHHFSDCKGSWDTKQVKDHTLSLGDLTPAKTREEMIMARMWIVAVELKKKLIESRHRLKVE